MAYTETYNRLKQLSVLSQRQFAILCAGRIRQYCTDGYVPPMSADLQRLEQQGIATRQHSG